MNPFHRYFRLALGHLALGLCIFVLSAVPALATPTDDITRAVAVNGVSDVSQARPRQFIKAFNAVALRTTPRELPDYVVAAIELRPDLAPNVVAVAIKATMKNWEAKPEMLCAIINRIIRAAIAVNPEAAPAIAKAGASASSEMRRCVLEGALAAAPDKKEAIVNAVNARSQPLAFLSFSAGDASGFSFTAATLSAANISDLRDDDNVTSPEQPPAH